MTIKEQREIIEAYERGEEIEIRYKENFNSQKWFSLNPICEHRFDFVHNEYRIKKRWRAEKGEEFFFIDYMGDVMMSVEDCDDLDNKCYLFGNYFRTSEVAKKARDLLKETLRKFHEDNE